MYKPTSRKRRTSDNATQTDLLYPVVVLDRLQDRQLGLPPRTTKQLPKRKSTRPTKCICRLPSRYHYFAKPISNNFVINSTLTELNPKPNPIPKVSTINKPKSNRQKKTVRFVTPEHSRIESNQDMQVPIMLAEPSEEYCERDPTFNLETIEESVTIPELELAFDEDDLYR